MVGVAVGVLRTRTVAAALLLSELGCLFMLYCVVAAGFDLSATCVTLTSSDGATCVSGSLLGDVTVVERRTPADGDDACRRSVMTAARDTISFRYGLETTDLRGAFFEP